MPTTLPTMTAAARQRRAPAFAKLGSIVMVAVYLLLLAWSVATLATNISVLFGHDQRQGEYNPMEPGRPTAAP
jgi:threonine/homoserine/homoserine lactone efflux protein